MPEGAGPVAGLQERPSATADANRVGTGIAPAHDLAQGAERLPDNGGRGVARRRADGACPRAASGAMRRWPRCARRWRVAPSCLHPPLRPPNDKMNSAASHQPSLHCPDIGLEGLEWRCHASLTVTNGQLAFTDSTIHDSLSDRPCGPEPLNATSGRLVSLGSKCGADGANQGQGGSARHSTTIYRSVRVRHSTPDPGALAALRNGCCR